MDLLDAGSTTPDIETKQSVTHSRAPQEYS